jgi:hypothetical protein
MIDGVTVSNFVFPSWFESFRKPGSSQFDFGNHLIAPFELGKGAYMTVVRSKRRIRRAPGVQSAAIASQRA